MKPRSWKLAGALAAVYLIWGSTYLAIRVALETLPPLSMTGVRFLAAGTALYVWARSSGSGPPTARQWRAAAGVGLLLVAVGNGGVVWAEQTVPSGLAALVVTTTPLWMVSLDALLWSGGPVSAREVAGIGLGIASVGVLFVPAAGGEGSVEIVGGVVLLVASLAWSVGSLLSRGAALPESGRLAAGMEMLVGGGAILVAGLALGEGPELAPGGVSLRSAAALVYLVILGSIVAYTAYLWLLRATTPALASSHAYVNPVIAVLLGWSLAGEPLTSGVGLATVGVVGAVVLITTARVPGAPTVAGRVESDVPAAPVGEGGDRETTPRDDR